MRADIGLHPILRPTRIGEWALSSRVYLAPINPGFASDGVPDKRLLRFHSARSGNGIAISYVGNVAVASDGVSNSATPIVNPRSLPMLQRIADTIKANGSRAGIQLAHSPAWLSPSRKWRARNTHDELLRLGAELQQAPAAWLDGALRAFVTSSALAYSAGFDVIQLHAAHGYLLSLLLCPETNRRTDSFGTPTDWFPPFLEEVSQAARGSLLSLRVSLSAQGRPGSSAADLNTLLVRSPVAILDVSSGFYTVDRRPIYPPKQPVPPLLLPSIRLATNMSCHVAFSGAIELPTRIPTDVPANLMIGLGRPLIADPRIVERSGREPPPLEPCRRTNRCHYFTRGMATFSCGPRG
jgi:2,4-dienoyl-CoA reductase-like NADH-dependent reductase (Old Yellow Enzyme family)